MRNATQAVAVARPRPRHRRSARFGERRKKVTLQVRASVVEAVKILVEGGEVASASAFVEEALEQRLREMRRARVYRAYREAANDEAFMKDMESTTSAFDSTTSDGLRESPRDSLVRTG